MTTFSIVTPSYNNSEDILDCLMSVATQKGSFSIEHIVVDGGSTDGTLEILEKFEKDIKSKKIQIGCKEYSFKKISEKDNGMYDAILKGFKHVSGEVMAWINTDDYYRRGAFDAVEKIFSQYPNLNWIKGITQVVNIDGSKADAWCKTYSRKLISRGIYGSVGYFIQQDSVFWKRSLWDKINSGELRKYEYAGDFRLWQLFSQYSALVSFDLLVSYFRKRNNQKSINTKAYFTEMNRTSEISILDRIFLKQIFKMEKYLHLNIINPRYIIFDSRRSKWRFNF